MTIIHVEEIRDMTPAEREAELDDLQTELLNARAVKAAGGAPENPGRIGELRKAIARIKTIQGEEGDLSEAEAASDGSNGRGRETNAQESE
jgi:large subunit ribosomal protein L29